VVHLPRGLLVRAAFYRIGGNLDRAHVDLEEAMRIAKRAGMRLCEADCHLAYVQLHLARGDNYRARVSLVAAEKIIRRRGYSRREKELSALEAKLNAGYP
jgi:hypothetical protein